MGKRIGIKEREREGNFIFYKDMWIQTTTK